MTFGEKLTKLRKARGWTQEELAEQAGVSRQSLSKWESDAALPDTARVIILCDLFGITADYLLRDKPQEAASASLPETGSAVSPEASPVPSCQPEAPRHRPQVTLIIGCILTVLGMLLWMPLRILSIFNPGDLTVFSGGSSEHYEGIQAFIRMHDLELVYYAGIALITVGLVTILTPVVLERLLNRHK